MNERPILFSAPMVRALLAGTKTQTRRIVKLPHMNPLGVWEPGVMGGPTMRTRTGETVPEHPVLGHSRTGDCIGPRWWTGDRMWVRETWMPDAPRNGEWNDTAFYGCGMSPLSDIPECYRHPWHCLHRATHEGCELVGWKPSIHMPRWASRILLEVTGVRVERLQDISEEDAQAEGAEEAAETTVDDERLKIECGYSPPRSYVHGYRLLWDQINGEGSWDLNPWVWAVSFKRVAS